MRGTNSNESGVCVCLYLSANLREKKIRINLEHGHLK